MTIDSDFAETMRLQMQTDLQALFTHSTTVKEVTVMQEFRDVAQIYPCAVMDITIGESPARHLGQNAYDLIRMDVFFLSVSPPTIPAHLVTCSDTKKRSGRELVEYLAIKASNYLKNYRPVDNIIEIGSDLVLNPESLEREGVFKTVVRYEMLI